MGTLVTWEAQWQNPLADYLADYRSLMGDQRTVVTFGAVVQGIIGAGSLVCERIAAQSAVLAAAQDGGQRVSRLATGESTKRSQLDAAHLTAQLRQRGVAQLAQGTGDELWLIADGSDLRKPYAQAMPALMQVRALDGALVPGYRTMNVLGVLPGRRGVLYHRLFSSTAADFVSEPAEIQQALQTVSQAVAALKVRLTVSWVLDRGFDDVAVWRTVWEQQERLVCRVQHPERLVEYRAGNDEWRAGDLSKAKERLRLVGTAQTTMVVQRGRQAYAKEQVVTAELRACPVRLTYETNVRREGPGETRQKELWLVEVRLLGTKLEPWLLITDWPVTDEASALHVFRMYRQRWAVEESFKFTKTCLGWEEVQLLDLTGIRTLVALAWVAAGFLYELGVTLEWAEVQLLARLGGWVARKDNKPGKIVLTRGLRRLLDMLVTQQLLATYEVEHGALPPRIAAWLGRQAPPDL
jgi:hypothetical protein